MIYKTVLLLFISSLCLSATEEVQQAALLKQLAESTTLRDYKASRGVSTKLMHLLSEEIRIMSTKERKELMTHFRYLATLTYKECTFFFPVDLDLATGGFQVGPGSSDGRCGE